MTRLACAAPPAPFYLCFCLAAGAWPPFFDWILRCSTSAGFFSAFHLWYLCCSTSPPLILCRHAAQPALAWFSCYLMLHTYLHTYLLMSYLVKCICVRGASIYQVFVRSLDISKTTCELTLAKRGKKKIKKQQWYSNSTPPAVEHAQLTEWIPLYNSSNKR